MMLSSGYAAHTCKYWGVYIYTEHEMEQKLQEHQQEMEKLTQDWQLEKDRIVYQTDLKLEAEEVSGWVWRWDMWSVHTCNCVNGQSFYKFHDILLPSVMYHHW